MTSGADTDEEEYQKGLDILSSLISGRVRSDGKNWSHAFDMMQVYLERLDLDKDLSKLSVIHVAGTKGKGSTCAMVESILRNAGYTTGLYTSPHLIDVRERIRINGQPIDKATFLRHLFSTYSTLDEKASDDAGKPAYFRFLTLLSFKIFLEQNVDVAIFEVGLGGRLDATNCIREPVVCGITPLGFDHMALLGHTLPEIAREKAGIFKKGRPAFTVSQREDAYNALVDVAKKVGTPLHNVRFNVDDYSCLDDSANLETETTIDTTNTCSNNSSSRDTTTTNNNNNNKYALEGRHPTAPNTRLTIGLAGEHQRQNASLAIALAAEWERSSPNAVLRTGHLAKERGNSVHNGRLPAAYVRGLKEASWPGRGQIVFDPCGDDGMESSQISFYLDGAHTAESMSTCAQWFAQEVSPLHNRSSNTNSTTNTNSNTTTNNTTNTNTNTTTNNTNNKNSSNNNDDDQSSIGCHHRILLFNCMDDRNPDDLLTPFMSTLVQYNNAMPHHAFFLPPESSYMQVRPTTTTTPLNTTTTTSATAKNTTVADLSWQIHLRNVWERLLVQHSMHTSSSLSLPTTGFRASSPLPPLPLVPGIHAVQDATRGAVLPNIHVALDWLRKCARERPSVKLHVLVTGSLYLVGDVLRILHSGKDSR